MVVGHFHMDVTSVAEHRKFWVDTLGGTPAKVGTADVVRFPGIVLFFDAKKPSGPNRGTAFDHIGFAVPDVPALTTKVVAAGYMLTSGREPVPGKEAAAAQGTQAPYGRFSYILGPDGAKVELVTSAEKEPAPIVYHHIHFINKQYVEMQQLVHEGVQRHAAGPGSSPTSSSAPTCPASATASTSSGGKATRASRTWRHEGAGHRSRRASRCATCPSSSSSSRAKGIKLTEGYKKSNPDDGRHRDRDDYRSLGRADRAD